MRLSRDPSAARRGFTLVELMAVVSILVVLMGLMVVGIGRYRVRAHEESTRARLDQIRDALEGYYETYRRYPPDGFDTPVYRTINGSQHQIRGAQCLVAFLAMPTERTYEVGVAVRTEEMEPFLPAITADWLSGDGDLEERLMRPSAELVDTFGNPIHYDNLERDADGEVRATNQTAPFMHTSSGFDASRMHGPDPRAAGGGVQPRNPGSYDLWSHGADVEDPTDDITNWD